MVSQWSGSPRFVNQQFQSLEHLLFVVPGVEGPQTGTGASNSGVLNKLVLNDAKAIEEQVQSLRLLQRRSIAFQ